MQKFKYRPRLNNGDLRHRITFYKPSGEIGEDGWPSTEPIEYDTVWGKVQTQRGTRIFNSDATQWQDKIVVTIRYRDDIVDGMLLSIDGGKLHEMISPPINDDGLNETLTLIVREKL
ncbi:MAG TPA: phage head closure protein [Brumimicrobium sp.]|nr:phage head closure protein [Brumimicrobium sp.]